MLNFLQCMGDPSTIAEKLHAKLLPPSGHTKLEESLQIAHALFSTENLSKGWGKVDPF